MVFLWDVATGRPIRKFRGHDNRVNCIQLNEEATIAVTGSYDKTVKIWDLKSNAFDAIQILSEAKDSVSSISLTPTEIIAGSVDGCIRIYDIRVGKLTSDSLQQPIAFVTLSHDGNCIVANCLDNSIRLIDKKEGELLNTYSGHKNSEFKIENRLTKDDAYILTGSEDGMVYVYDLVEAKVVNKLSGHQRPCVTLDYHPTNSQLITGSFDTTIKLWGSHLIQDSLN